jgi:streptogramin lyase
VARKRLVQRHLGVEKLEDRCLLSGGITEIPFPGGSGAPLDITAGADGNLWFTQVQSGVDTSQSTFIGRITPDGTVTEFPIPEQGFGLLESPLSLHITSGPDGNLWFTGHNIGRMTTAGVVTEFMLPSDTTSEAPFAITAGPDGNIWFTEIPTGFTLNEPAGRIGRITPAGQITEFTLPTAGSEPRAITAGPDENLWFTENGPAGGRKIGRITPSGVITEFALSDQNGAPEAITRGPDGNLWFTGEELVTTGPGVPSGTFIGRITPSGDITEFPIPDNAYAPAITSGSDGNLYFTEQYANKIGRITPNGTISEFTIPTIQVYPEGITAGPDGNVWFAEGFNGFTWQSGSNQIGKFIVSVSGTPNQRYVSQLYLDLLHRPADPSGLAGWVSMLDNGTGRFQIVLGIENSPEYHNLEVQGFYHRFLNRAASPAELNLWQNYFNLGGTAEQVQSFVIGSDEYLARHANSFDSHAFLTSAYSDIFNRPIDDTGVQAWTQALANGMSRSDVALALLRSLESDRDEVIDLYGRLLHRDPDPSGFGFFATALQNGLSNELATALLTTSSEYLASVGIASPTGISGP